MASWPAKSPNDVLDYSLTWAKQMTLDSDTIAEYTATVVEGSAVIIADGDPLYPGKGPSHDDTETLLWLRGGEDGEQCRIVNHIKTTTGREYDHTRTVKIKDL